MCSLAETELLHELRTLLRLTVLRMNNENYADRGDLVIQLEKTCGVDLGQLRLFVETDLHLKEPAV